MRIRASIGLGVVLAALVVSTFVGPAHALRGLRRIGPDTYQMKLVYKIGINNLHQAPGHLENFGRSASFSGLDVSIRPSVYPGILVKRFTIQLTGSRTNLETFLDGLRR
jgi:hypothetical protein